MKSKGLTTYSTAAACLCFFVLTGCAAVIIGAGVGAGAFAYINGKLIRTYESEYHAAINAGKETLEDLKIPIHEVAGDELNAVIRAQRPDGTQVTIEVEKVEHNLTEISVRTGTVGIWDRKVSTKIHELIDEKLARSTDNTSAVLVIDEPDQAGDRTTHTLVYADEPGENKSSQEVQEESSPALDNQSAIWYTPPKNSILIYFNLDSNELSKESTETLDRLAKIMVENSSDQIVVDGFSDSTGPASYNKMLSESRANIVKVYLIGKGVKPARISTNGLGAQKFITSNETEEGRRLNRRVEIVYIGAGAD